MRPRVDLGRLVHVDVPIDDSEGGVYRSEMSIRNLAATREPMAVLESGALRIF